MTNQFKIFKGSGVLAGYANTIQETMSRCDAQRGWYFEKDGKLTKEEINYKVLRLCINKQLEVYRLNYDNVKKGESFEYWTDVIVTEEKYLWFFKRKKVTEKKVIWYQHLTFESEQEFNEWKEFCINLFRKELKMSKKAAEAEFDWFNLSYGLKQNYELDK